MQNQRHEADRRVRLYPVGQAVVDRADFQFGFEHLEAPLDIGERLIAGHDLRR